MTKKRIIGIVGTIGSGKDTAAEYLGEKLGIPVYTISSPLKDIARERGIAETRENLVALGRQIAAEKGQTYLAEVLLQKIEKKGVIVGMRQPPQIEYLRSHADLTLVAIDADPAVRFARAVARGKAGEAKTFEEFMENERQENTGTVQNVFACMEQADVQIMNDGTLEGLYRALDPFAKI